MTKNTQKIDNLEIDGLISSLENKELDSDQIKTIQEILSTFRDVCSSLKEKKMSIQRLKALLGIKTEKSKNTRGIPSDKNITEKKSQKKAQTLKEIQFLVQLKK